MKKEELEEFVKEMFDWVDNLTFDMVEELKKSENPDATYYDDQRDKFIRITKERLDHLTK